MKMHRDHWWRRRARRKLREVRRALSVEDVKVTLLRRLRVPVRRAVWIEWRVE